MKGNSYEENSKKNQEVQIEKRKQSDLYCLSVESNPTQATLLRYCEDAEIELSASILEGVFAQLTSGLYGILGAHVEGLSETCSFSSFLKYAKPQSDEILETFSAKDKNKINHSALLELALSVLSHYAANNLKSEISAPLLAEGHSEVFLLGGKMREEKVVKIGTQEIKLSFQRSFDELEVCWEEL